MQSNLSHRKKVLILAFIWPERHSSAAGLRTWNWIQTFQKAGWEVHLASAAEFSSPLSREEFIQAGLILHSIRLNDASFDPWIAALRPALCLFDRFITEEQFGWRVRHFSPETLRWIDTQDLHFVRRFREKLFSLNPVSSFTLKMDELPFLDPLFLKQQETLLRELAAFYRSDLSFVLSDVEYRLLTQTFALPAGLLQLSRFHYPKLPFISSLPSFEARQHFIFLGNFRHPPNADAIQWLKKALWPAIRARLPQSELHIYGAYPLRELVALHEPSLGFLIQGTASDVGEVLKSYRVNLAPLRFGAGIKGKITDGWYSGTPVLASPIAAEGMAEELPWGGWIVPSPSPEVWADMALESYLQPFVWIEKQKNGFEILDKLYSQEEEQKKLVSLFAHSLEKRAQSTQTFWVNRLLWHQSQRSTEYFARWIEEKEKSKR